MAHFLLRAGDFLLQRRHALPVIVAIPPKPIAQCHPGRAVVGPSRRVDPVRPPRGLAFYSLTAGPRAVGPRGRLARFALIPDGGGSSARAEEPWTDLP